jgi:Domain of unknown function (DUF6431)
MIAGVAIVWPCRMSIEQYAAAGRDVPVPRPHCPTCSEDLSFEGSYPRVVRDAHGKRWALRIRRGRCRRCDRSEALLPDFVVKHRLDTIDTVGDAIIGRPLAETIPRSTARSWLRRFRRHEPVLRTGLAATYVALAGTYPPVVAGSTETVALIGACWHAAALKLARRGLEGPPPWRLANVITGSTLIATRVTETWPIASPSPRPPPRSVSPAQRRSPSC